MDIESHLAYFKVDFLQPSDSHKQRCRRMAQQSELQDRQIGLNFYELVSVLFTEAKTIPLYIHLIRQQIEIRNQKRASCQLNKKLFELWESYIAGNLRTYDVLEQCFLLYNEKNTYVIERDVKNWPK